MKQRSYKRLLALLVCLVLSFSLLSGLTAGAADTIWTEPPTDWRHWSHVVTKTVDGHLCNWGVRGETALFLTDMAEAYYSDNPWGVGFSWGYFMWSENEGGTGVDDAADSPLYQALHDLMAGKHTHLTSYNETRDLYRYTDCMVNDSDHISSFYSGRKLNGAWDSAETWNREHTWPKSKASGSQNNDIMMLRPTSLKENSSRANMAYGEGTGYYDPNSEAGGQFDLRGDCARICLYCYVRWSENADNMWGLSGVIQDLDLLLDWMEQDPVDTWEMGRNDAVQDITGVRNCFVDYPELAWHLFGREVPAGYPTPMNGGQEWPPASAVLSSLTAVPDDPAHGSVEVVGLAAAPHPADGYYASGYDVLTTGVWYVDPDAPDPYEGLLKWDRFGRLLLMQTRETDVSVVIHFTQNGKTDPCPTGHAPDWEHPVVTAAPTCTEDGRQEVTCTRCGAVREFPIFALGHAWDAGVVTKSATFDEWGVRLYTCTRCGETLEDSFRFEFDDVKDPSKFYYDSVYWALFNDPRITSGVDDTHFAPKQSCTRAEVVTFLWRAMGEPIPQALQGGAEAQSPFVDVKPTSYYFTAVVWAVENGVTAGTDETHFSPKQVCTRGEVVTFLHNAAGKPAPLGSDCPFEDAVPGKYYYQAMLWAVENGVTAGTDETHFSPKQTCTRGQVVTFLYNAAGLLP